MATHETCPGEEIRYLAVVSCNSGANAQRGDRPDARAEPTRSRAQPIVPDEAELVSCERVATLRIETTGPQQGAIYHGKDVPCFINWFAEPPVGAGIAKPAWWRSSRIGRGRSRKQRVVCLHPGSSNL